MSREKTSQQETAKRAFGILLVACGFIFLIVVLFLSGCVTAPLPPPKPVVVVAPASPEQLAAQQALQSELSAQHQAASAQAAALSAIAASADNVQSFTAEQPAGKFTTATQAEAGLILSVAGKPSAVDQAAAAQRRLAVVSGNLAVIQTAYSGASRAIQTLQTQLGDTKTALDASNAALTESEAKAAVAQKQAASALQSQFNAKQAEINATRAAATAALSKEQARQRLLETGIFFGLSALLFLAAVACFWLKSIYPLFGTRAALSLLGGSIGLAAMGTAIMEVQNFIALHPDIFWFSLLGSAVLGCGAIFLIYSNHWHAQHQPVAATTLGTSSVNSTITKLP